MPEIRQTISHYRVLEKIGRGGGTPGNIETVAAALSQAAAGRTN